VSGLAEACRGDAQGTHCHRIGGGAADETG